MTLIGQEVLIELIPLCAGMFTSSGLITQARKTWRERSAASLSLGMYGCHVTGVFLWFNFAMMTGSMAMTFWTSINFCLSASILCMKLRWG